MKLQSKLKAAPTIPFIALADIAWQIIIFLVLTVSFAKSDAMNIDLPGATNVAKADQKEPVLVNAGNNLLMLDNKRVTWDMKNLQERIKKLLAGRKTEQERAVVLVSRDDLTFQQQADVMYAIQQAGGVLVLSEEK